ncbi:MAG: response regulator, partial [Lachnospirales bacterium]
MEINAEVLIVDDVSEQIAFAGTILKNEGYRVYAATSGKGAIKFLENKIPHIIMLDIKMEDIDGLEVCKIIKNNPKTK